MSFWSRWGSGRRYFSVVTVWSALQPLLTKRFLAEVEPPEMAFVDINIRGDRDGIAVARALTHRHATSCVFLTAQVDLARSARDAALGVLEKPYDLPDILHAARVVAAIRKGETLVTPPGHLELFRWPGKRKGQLFGLARAVG
jgi:DNA-binding LytR/AlgR family response regulator